MISPFGGGGGGGGHYDVKDASVLVPEILQSESSENVLR